MRVAANGEGTARALTAGPSLSSAGISRVLTLIEGTKATGDVRSIYRVQLSSRCFLEEG